MEHHGVMIRCSVERWHGIGWASFSILILLLDVNYIDVQNWTHVIFLNYTWSVCYGETV